MQHGSILLERSPHAAEFSGIRELTGVLLDAAALSAEVGSAIVEVLGTEARPAVLDAAEDRRAHELEAYRYATIRWRNRQ